MEIKSVKNAIEEAVIKSRKLKESILKARWSEVVGEMAKKSTPLYIREGILYSLVEGPVFLQHMNMNKNNYLQRANSVLKGEYLQDMRFKVGRIALEEYFHEENVVEGGDMEICLTTKEIEEIRRSSEEIPDPELRERIIHLKEESLKREKYLLKRGYKKCIACGTPHERSRGDLCRICENKKVKDREERVFKIFSKNPYTSFEEMEEMIPGMTRDEYKKYKDKKLDKIYRRAYFLVVAKKEEAAVECLYNYFRLETGNRNEYEVATKSRNLMLVMKEKIAEV